MDLNTSIVAVFCLIDDRLKDLGRLRARGPAPTLSNSEVLTIQRLSNLVRRGAVPTVSEKPSHIFGTHGCQCPAHRLNQPLLGVD